ncbi:MAG: 6-bladed beta-propeller [Candidatus Cloacimonetes bacterium]|nr:6-bladed beta-propeller [Candidatus Cloacimonadota bacterium]
MRKLAVIIVFCIGFGLSIPAADKVNTDLQVWQLELKDSYQLSEEISDLHEYIITDNKIMFASIQAKMVWYLNLDGTLFTVLDKAGQGPGEFSMPQTVYDDTKYQRIGIVDQMNRRTSYYDYSGNYIMDELFPGMDVPMSKTYFADAMLYYFFGIEIDQDKGSILTKPTLKLILDEEELVIYTDSFNPLMMNVSSSGIPLFACLDQNIYVSALSHDNYSINIYNLQGELKNSITKKYKKIKKTEAEVEELENMMEDITRQFKGTGVEMNFQITGYDYKYAINELLIGPEGNLWVQTQDNEGDLFDIYSEQGELIALCRFPTPDSGICRIYSGELLEIKSNEYEDFYLNHYLIRK